MNYLIRIKNQKLSAFDYLVFVLTIAIFSNTLSFVNESWFLICFGLCLFFKLLIKNRKEYKSLILVLVVWSLINLSSFTFHQTTFGLITFLGYSVRLCIAFFLINIYGNRFWILLERFIFPLTFVSLILFFLNLIFPFFFYQLGSFFQPIVDEVYLQKDAQSGYWNNFFYTYTGRNDGRNAGFMWEPGSFALVLVLMILVNWINYGVFLNKRIFLYMFSILTTFSTAGFFSLLLFFLAYFFSKKVSIIYMTFFALLVVFNINFFYQDFLFPKINSFLVEAEENVYYEQGYTERLEANRIAYFGINFSKNLIYPFGHGVVEDYKSFGDPIKIVGVGGLSDILYKWGFIGLFLFLILIWRFIFKNRSSSNLVGFTIFSYLSFIIVLFSNPIENNLVAFLILFSTMLKER